MAEEHVETEEVQEENVSKTEYDAIVAERDELLKYKPVEQSDEEKALEAKRKELFDKEVSLALKENGLEAFSEVINVSDTKTLEATVKALKVAVNELKVSNSYVPADHAQTSEYDSFAQKNDTKGMIATKFAKLFG